MDFKYAWFSNPKWWFPSEEQKVHIDDYLRQTYEHLLETSEEYDNITKILIYDQLVRHCFRNGEFKHVIEFYLQKALQCSLTIIKSGDYKYLANEELVFSLLPLRHTQRWKYINIALSLIWERLDETNLDITMLKRFLRAAYSRVPNDQSSYLKFYNSFNSFDHNDDNYNDFSDILVNNIGIKHDPIDDGKIFEGFLKLISTNKTQTIIVSLSGGVDSMVCSYVLNDLRKTYNYNLIAVHINYGNKSTACKDENFVIYWCNKLDIPLYVRYIAEIKRDVCMKHELREIYENYTRNVRFSTYKTAWNDADTYPIVILGHNKNDCFENILTNITHCQKYDNLFGMHYVSNLDGITFWRPLLNAEKSEIRSFACKHSIPHLHDSTPTWSQRGKIRDKVMPTLKEWNRDNLDGFFELSKVVSDLYCILEEKVLEMCHRTTNGRLILHQNELKTNSTLWKRYFEKCYHVSVSKQSLKNFCDRLETFHKKKNLRIVINKSFTIKINLDQNTNNIMIERM